MSVNDGKTIIPVSNGFIDISIRDTFALNAMTSLYSGMGGTLKTDQRSIEVDAKIFYSIADAMLEARK